LFCLVVGVIALFGGYRIEGVASVEGMLTVIGMSVTVAVTEEVLYRGIVFRLIAGRFGPVLALIVSALLFGATHLVNPGATLWGALAVALEAGLMLAAAFLLTRSLWLPIALHLAWNSVSVGVFGTIGSGGEAREGLLRGVFSGPDWLTGGAFGAEGSVVAIVICSAATVVLLILARVAGAARSHAPSVRSISTVRVPSGAMRSKPAASNVDTAP
jgi:membrane protease YdiL (CAAX protease family)